MNKRNGETFRVMGNAIMICKDGECVGFVPKDGVARKLEKERGTKNGKAKA